MLQITTQRTTTPKAKPDESNLGFGVHYTDHMLIIDHDEEKGWHDARIVPYQPLELDPAAMVFHYAMESFEGLKAYRTPDGGVQLFRPWDNMARLNKSCDRIGLPRINPMRHSRASAPLSSSIRTGFPPIPVRACISARSLFSTDPDLALHGVHEAVVRRHPLPRGQLFQERSGARQDHGRDGGRPRGARRHG